MSKNVAVGANCIRPLLDNLCLSSQVRESRASATGLNSNGGLTINDTDPNMTPNSLIDIDFNPERIQIDDLGNPGV